MAGLQAPRLAVFTKNRTNPAYAAARLGTERAASRYGAVVVHYVPEKPDDVEAQIALIERALSERPDAFVFVPVHVTAVNAAIREVQSAGIPIVNYINRMTEGDPVAFVGSDDRRLAAQIAAYLFRHLGGRGDVVMIEGAPGSATSRERAQGFRDALDDFPAIRLVASRSADYQRGTARRIMRELLASLPRIDGVLSANDVMSLGVIDVLSERGLKIPLIGINAIPEAIRALKAGTLLATVDFDAMKMGCVAAEAALRYLRGEPVPQEIILPVQIVDRSNCEPWDKPLEERECPEWRAVAGME